MFLCLYESLCTKSIKSKYKTYTKIIYSLCIMMTILNGTVKFLQNVHSLNQLFVGYAIGYGIYYIFFKVLNYNLEDPIPFIELISNF